MKADLVIISSVILAVLLFFIGCETESGSAAQKTESASVELSEAPQPPQQQSQQAEVETELMITLPEETQTEAEIMTEQPAETEIPAGPETEVTAEQPAELQPATEPQTQAAEPTPQPSPNDIVVTVNGTPVKYQRLDMYLEPRLQELTSSRKLTDEQLAEAKDSLVRRLTQVLVIETLIDQNMKENNIVVTDQQIDDYIAQMAARENITLDDLKAIVTRGGGTFEQWKERRRFDYEIGLLKLAELKGLGTTDVNEAEALAYYQQNHTGYEIPEKVRASHILITPEKGPDVDPNAADAAAKEKAEQLLEQIKAGADFAKLARENSDCPSASDGGDIGLGERQTWVAPFSDAAFALQIGQVSDVVKTQFGYHIIKVTGRIEASKVSFDNVKENIIHALRAQKEAELTFRCAQLLKKNAEIVYAEGYEPEQADDTKP
jgi:peptidyl-prolyl cis-trans isomerase C